jgi:hypothetical protein
MSAQHDRLFGSLQINLSRPAAELKQRARAFASVGFLPRHTVHRVQAGYGPANRCTLCESEVSPDQLRYTVRRYMDPSTFTFHVECFLALEAQTDIRDR